MSVRTMARVWAESKHAGSELLMLLAIADFSDDEGNAYPAVTTLAAKCRMKTRNANYILSELQVGGELEVHVNKGPRGTNRYQIVLGKVTKGGQRVAGVGVQSSAGVQRVAGVQSSVDTPALQCSKPLHCSADEPSMNHQEPPKKVARMRASEVRVKSFDATSIALPSWLASEVWCEWVADRDERKKPITKRAAEQQLQKLDEYRAAGHDPAAVISHCIANGYQGLYPPSKPPTERTTNRRSGVADPARFNASDYEVGATVGVDHD